MNMWCGEGGGGGKGSYTGYVYGWCFCGLKIERATMSHTGDSMLKVSHFISKIGLYAELCPDYL